jgi:hypothetical protein
MRDDCDQLCRLPSLIGHRFTCPQMDSPRHLTPPYFLCERDSVEPADVSPTCLILSLKLETSVGFFLLLGQRPVYL